MNHYFLLTIDVEDWFQVENFKKYIPFDSWPSYEMRVEKNTHRILDLFDLIGSKKTEDRMQKTVSNNENQASRIQYSDNGQQSTDNGQDEKVRGTFFVLGWLAERLPHLVREIHSRGHEVASHGYYHNLCNDQSHEDLKADLCDSKTLLEDIIGTQVYGYRAPSFAINNDILKIIEECGYLYDSSYNSFAMHGRYGKISLNEQNRVGIVYKISSDFYEFPISNLKSKIQNLELPWGGGGYFRLIPFPIFHWGVQLILKKEKTYLCYLHPWELDPGQPRLKEASMFYRFRHYINLDKTASKLSSFIEAFKQYHFTTCHQYLKEIIKKNE